NLQPQTDGWVVTVENRTDHPFAKVQIAIGNELFALGELKARESKPFTVSKGGGTPISEFVGRQGQGFQTAVQHRQQAFGSTESGHLDDLPNASVAASFLSLLARQQNYMNFSVTTGLDMSSMLEHGNAVLFAWAGDYSPVQPFYHFTPRRSHRDTLWRVTVP